MVLPQSGGYYGNVVPLSSNDNMNALDSYYSPHMENHFVYFSHLHNNDGDDHDDPKIAYKGANLTLKEFSEYPPPLWLRLTTTPALQQLIDEKLYGPSKTISPCQPTAKKDRKLNAVHFPMQFLMIGFFTIEARYAADLVAKCYYAKRKLVWEILRNGLKEKIEIHWQDILSLQAVLEENKPGILKIELDRVPSFYCEPALKSGKQTSWALSGDFTTGQASKCRRHYLQFPPGVLDQHYMTLLQNDRRLLELSKKPFPSLPSPYFDSHVKQRTTHFHFGHDHQQVQQFDNMVPSFLFATNGPTSGSVTNEPIKNQMLQDQHLAYWTQGFDYYEILFSAESIPPTSYLQRIGPWSNNEPPSHINNILQTDYHVPEIEFDKRNMKNIAQSIVAISDLSMEASLACNSNTGTQVDWINTNENSWKTLANGSGEQYNHASNANLNSMHQDPFVYQPHNANMELEPMDEDPFEQSTSIFEQELITFPHEECNEDWF